MSCLFCSIVAGDIPAELIGSNDGAIAFRDINPQAPTHLLVVSRAHHRNVADLTEDKPGLSAVLELATTLGGQAGDGGFRLVFNTGPDAGQSVEHVHCHVLAGRELQWPPG